MARQALSSCQQQTGESASTFANRLLLLVRAATSGQDPASQKDRVLEEFVARLRPDIRYYVKLDNPATFEQAVAKAQMVEQLLAEATADRLIRPSQPGQAIEVKAAATSGQSFRRPNYETPRNVFTRGRAQFPQQSRDRQSPRPARTVTNNTCFNCGGVGHFSRQCPSPRVSRGTADKPVRRSLSSDRNYNQSSSRGFLPPSRYERDRELSQARDQIRALSISLQENQSALERSDARVNALVKRNEELANSAFGTSTPRSSTTSMPPVKFLFTISMLVCAVIGEPISTSAWLFYHRPDGDSPPSAGVEYSAALGRLNQRRRPSGASSKLFSTPLDTPLG
ncbi:hypothetical protein V3C99_000209 [Haemonchus contortus]